MMIDTVIFIPPGLPSDLKINTKDLKTPGKVPCIVERLCNKHQGNANFFCLSRIFIMVFVITALEVSICTFFFKLGIVLEAKGIKEHYWKPFVQKLFTRKVNWDYVMESACLWFLFTSVKYSIIKWMSEALWASEFYDTKSHIVTGNIKSLWNKLLQTEQGLASFLKLHQPLSKMQNFRIGTRQSFIIWQQGVVGKVLFQGWYEWTYS